MYTNRQRERREREERKEDQTFHSHPTPTANKITMFMQMQLLQWSKFVCSTRESPGVRPVRRVHSLPASSVTHRQFS